MSEEKKIKERLEVLRAMNTIAKFFNHEDAYLNWICGAVPDQADEDDLESIAEDEEMFSDAVDVFKFIWKTYLKDGLYVGDKVY